MFPTIYKVERFVYVIQGTVTISS